MNLFVIRHGQVDNNFNNIIASFTEVDLNDTGIKQAKEASKKLLDIEYDIVFCSPQKRTRSTMNIVNIKNKNVIYEDRLKERNAGNIEGKSTTEINLEDYWNIYSNSEYEGAETLDNLFKRVYAFLDDLKNKEEYKNYENVLIITHDGVCRTIHCYFNGIPENGNIRLYRYDNCEIRRYVLNK